MENEVIVLIIVNPSSLINCDSWPMLTPLQATNTRDVNQGPLPDYAFIASNQPEARPVPPTTTTRVRRMSAKAKEAAEHIVAPAKRKATATKKVVGVTKTKP